MAREALNRHLPVSTQTPHYPADLQRRGVKASGVFDMDVDYESGHIREVHIVQSTGNPILDRNTVVALKSWRARPRSIHTLRLPVNFGG
ncbi:MAG: TonB family protein [Chthoniobacterales bacterium]